MQAIGSHHESLPVTSRVKEAEDHPVLPQSSTSQTSLRNWMFQLYTKLSECLRNLIVRISSCFRRREADSQRQNSQSKNNVPPPFYSIQNEVISVADRELSDAEFTKLKEIVINTASIKTIVITKSLFKDSQLEGLQAFVSANKGVKVIDSTGQRVGPVYMDWHQYNLDKANAHENGMRITTIKALEEIQKEGKLHSLRVLDFGAGTGQDSIPLVKLGCQEILAVDGDLEALEILKSHVPDDLKSHVTCVHTAFIKLDVPKPYDLLVSSYTWPYRPPSDFPACWKKCVEVVKEEGYIAGQFFGPPKEIDPGLTFHTEQQIRDLLAPDFDIVYFVKIPEGTKLPLYGGADNSAPPWGDLFHVVARKKTR